MLNRNKIIFSTLLLITLIYAASVIGVSAQSANSTMLKHKRKTAIYVVLKDKCGFTDNQIKKAREDGKNAFELAKEKGIDENKLKALVYEEKCRRLDEKVKSGKITAEKAEEIKVKIKAHIEKWDGSFRINKNKPHCNKYNDDKKQ
jgi:hypothetical protein